MTKLPAIGLALALISPSLAQEIASTDPQEVCGKVDGMSYSKRHRAFVPLWQYQEDFAKAGIPWSEHKKYVRDHIVPLDLGGAETEKNRQLQHCDKWHGTRCIAGEAAKKDQLEDHDWRWVCGSGTADARIRLPQAQEHYNNWKAAYKQVFGVDP